MSRCKACHKPIKWIEVVDSTAASGLRWKAFTPRKSYGDTYTPHVCHKKEKPRPIDPNKPKPWWLKDD